MRRPVIGITTSLTDNIQKVDHAYIQAIELAGGLPVIAPVLHDEQTAREFADLLDGLVMTGGPAITDGLIGQLPDDLQQTDPRRVQSERWLYDAFMNKESARKPILGICYGMQFLNAMAGGTIYADVQAQQSGAAVHSSGRGATGHMVQVQPNTHLQAVLQMELFQVNSRHIQAIATVGSGLRVNAISPDGVIEGVESQDGRLLGVQFHPEAMPDSAMPLFVDFVRRCGKSNS